MSLSLEQRIANLSPEKRALLEKRLRQDTNPTQRQHTIPLCDRSQPLPLSFSQQRLWYIDQLEPGTTAYNTTHAYCIKGLLDIDILEQAITEIVRRHEVMRTTFTTIDGQPIQVIQPETGFRIKRIDSSVHRNTTLKNQIQELTAEINQQAFDLSNEFPVRIFLLQIDTVTHVLFHTTHHIASDGWSNAIFWRELSTVYGSLVSKKTYSLPDLPIQYADFAAWQSRWIESDDAKRQLVYWTKILHNSPPLLELPFSRPRPAKRTFQGEIIRAVFPVALLEQIQDWARTNNATLFMALLAGMNTLLFRYCGQNDLVIGTPIANRIYPEMEGLIGFFLNNLALRTQLSPAMSGNELLALVREQALADYQNQTIPFELVLQKVQAERALSHTPLFQIMLILQNTPPKILNLGGLEIAPFERYSNSSPLDLTFSFRASKNGLEATVFYSTDLFDRSNIQRMITHFQVLLDSLSNYPQQSISTLPMLNQEDYAVYRLQPNAIETITFSYPSLVEQFIQSAAIYPEQIAYIGDEEEITFSQLMKKVDLIADRLIQYGIKSGNPVGLCMERSIDGMAALWAIFRVGGVYVPLDPAYPAERLHYICGDANLELIITKQHWQKILFTETSKTKLFCIDDLTISTLLPILPLVKVSPDDPAYIIYTSGSTGRPKGVVVPHRQILNRLAWMWTAYPLQTEDVGCQKTALNFVDSLWEILGYLLQGRPTVVVSDEALLDPSRLVAILAKNNVTQIWLVPSFLRLLLNRFPDLQNHLPRLRFWVSSGEQLSSELMNLFSHTMPNATLYNLYGTSEVWDATWYDPVKEHWLSRLDCAVPIGRPIDNVLAIILDENLQLVPQGITGELCIGGVGLADGYLNRPEQTKERFVQVDLQHPFSASRLLYRTGDLARVDENGCLTIVGRRDQQVKLRGFRIELGEIETVLNQHPDVAASAVIVANAESPVLVAYWVAMSDDAAVTPNSSLLRSFLQAKLPAHMLPSRFIRLDSLPKTPSGKLDKLALSKLASMSDTTGLSHVDNSQRASDALQQQLVQLWEATLGRKPIGIDERFFDLGGHSLLAVLLFERIHRATGAKLPLATLYHSPTIRTLAEKIREGNWAPPWKSLIAIRPGGERVPLFIVPPAGSTVLHFSRILDGIVEDLPLYGLQHHGIEDDAQPHTDTVEMARYFVEQIRLLRPQGPYQLAGICFGAHVAFEMAQQLTAQGEKVELLIAVDAGAPANGPGWHNKRMSKSKLQLHLSRLREAWQTGDWALWRDYYGTVISKRIRRWQNPQRQQHHRVLWIHWQAQLGYVAQPLKVPVLLIQSTQYARRQEIVPRWKILTGDHFRLKIIPNCSHLELLNKPPFPSQVAQAINDFVHEIDNGAAL